MKQPIYNTTLYLRLSCDDELQGESSSMTTQRSMLRQYAAENGLNVIDEWVARDTSRKAKSAMKVRFAEGALYGAYAPLGYWKDPDAKGKLLIDEDTPWIIKKIFDLASHGMGGPC